MEKKQELVGVCAVCLVIYRLGYLPMSHGYCVKCYEDEMRKIENMR